MKEVLVVGNVFVRRRSVPMWKGFNLEGEIIDVQV